MDALTPQEIDKAHERIFPLIIKTPLISSETINKKTNANVYFKLENLQWTGSFKLRGASNKILQLSNEEKSRGIVSYSSGNHAQAVAYASNLFGVQATIIMPKNAPSIKIENTKKYGADIIFYDYKHESREKIASEIARKENKKIIKPYDDLDVIAGQGTVGKEIAEELRLKNIQPDLYLCCCGSVSFLLSWCSVRCCRMSSAHRLHGRPCRRRPCRAWLLVCRTCCGSVSFLLS